MKRDLPGMELDLCHFDERETFSFSERFTVPTQEGGTAECGITVTGEVYRTGSRLLLDARVACKVRVECSRCLCEFDLPVDTGFKLVFHRGERVSLPEGVEEDDFILLSDTVESRYDIFPRVREAIILELPIKYLCSEDCKGLCSKCGADLNQGECDCSRDIGDPRWGTLRKLLSTEEDD